MTHPDLTERLPCPFPLVYGFIRLSSRSAARRAALGSAVTRYCDQHELRFGGMFTEYGHPRAAMSAAFAGLLDVLAMPGVYGVVIPSESHLGAEPLASGRRCHVEHSGARLMIIRSRKRRPSPT